MALVYAIGSSARHHDPVVALILAGVVVGTLLGSLTSLLKVLAVKFGAPSAVVVARLRAADAVKVDGMLERVLTAQTVGELLDVT